MSNCELLPACARHDHITPYLELSLMSNIAFNSLTLIKSDPYSIHNSLYYALKFNQTKANFEQIWSKQRNECNIFIHYPRSSQARTIFSWAQYFNSVLKIILTTICPIMVFCHTSNIFIISCFLSIAQCYKFFHLII